MKTNLVLTGNTEILDKEYNNILSGEWCLQNKNFKNKIADVNYKVIQYHWSDIEKKKKDFVYLNDLYPRLLKSFCNFLNFYHKTNKPERYWHIIIGPWLAKSLPILYDRWETIKFLISKNKFDKITVLNLNKDFLITKDFKHFISIMHNHSWNNVIFKEILNELNINYKLTEVEKTANTKKLKKNKIKVFLNKSLDNFLKLFNKNSNLLLYKSNFGHNSLIKIFLLTGILSRNYFEFENDLIKNNEKKNRKEIHIKFSPSNSFERFLNRILFSLMPMSHVENFGNYLKKVKKVDLNPKVIFTTFGHFDEDFFKTWVAEKVLENKKFIICSHGGWVEQIQSFDFHKKIADKYIIWQKNNSKNVMQMPLNFSLNKKKILNKNHGKDLLFLTYEVELYAHRIQDGPLSSEIVGLSNHWFDFLDKLDKPQKDKINFRHGYPFDKWNIKNEFNKNFSKNFLSKNKKIEQDFKKAKFVVNTQMQTTFFETVKLGLPTFIILKNDLWNLSDDIKRLYYDLKKHNVIFTDITLAANHLKSIWSDPLSWWNSTEILKLRDRFSYECCLETQNNFELWINFFKKIKNEK